MTPRFTFSSVYDHPLSDDMVLKFNSSADKKLVEITVSPEEFISAVRAARASCEAITKTFKTNPITSRLQRMMDEINADLDVLADAETQNTYTRAAYRPSV